MKNSNNNSREKFKISQEIKSGDLKKIIRDLINEDKIKISRNKISADNYSASQSNFFWDLTDEEIKKNILEEEFTSIDKCSIKSGKGEIIGDAIRPADILIKSENDLNAMSRIEVIALNDEKKVKIEIYLKKRIKNNFLKNDNS